MLRSAQAPVARRNFQVFVGSWQFRATCLGCFSSVPCPPGSMGSTCSGPKFPTSLQPFLCVSRCVPAMPTHQQRARRQELLRARMGFAWRQRVFLLGCGPQGMGAGDTAWQTCARSARTDERSSATTGRWCPSRRTTCRRSPRREGEAQAARSGAMRACCAQNGARADRQRHLRVRCITDPCAPAAARSTPGRESASTSSASRSPPPRKCAGRRAGRDDDLCSLQRPVCMLGGSSAE